MVSSSYDNTLLIWNLMEPNLKPKKLSGHKSLVNDLSISPTGFLIASASSDHTVRIWSNIIDDKDYNNGQSQILKHNSAPVKSVDFSCDSKLIATGSDDKTVKLINVADRRLLANLLGHSNWVKCVRFSQDSRLLASTADDKSVRLWDVNKGVLNYSLLNIHNGVVNAVRFHPDNSLIATACFDKKIRLFDIRSKRLVQVYDQHKKNVTSVAFHPSGFYMASSSFDETVKIFDLRNGEIMFTLTGHEGASTAVSFSKYGDYFATGGSDSLVILWKSNLELPANDNNQNIYDFPIENDREVNPSSSSNYATQKSTSTGNKVFNSETPLNYKNKKTLNTGSDMVTNGNIGDVNSIQENISEELSKVFEKMVYQLELITRYKIF